MDRQHTNQTLTTDIDLNSDEYEVLETTASRNAKPFRGLIQRENPDGSTFWDFGTLGAIANLRYQNPMDAKKQGPNDQVFISGDNSYNLAASKTSPVDQQDILEPLLNQGWQVGSHHVLRSGIRFVTTLTHPDQAIEDFITWDHSLWQGHAEDPRQRILKPAITIRADLQTSTQIHLSAGFFRLICLNGLTSKVMNMGHLSISSRNFDHAKIEDMGTRTTADSFHRNTLRELPAPAIGQLGQLIEREDSELPRLVREPLHRIVSTLSRKDRDSLGQQFQAIEAAGLEKITVMDTLSAITSATKNIRVLDRLDSLTQDLSDLIELQSFRWN